MMTQAHTDYSTTMVAHPSNNLRGRCLTPVTKVTATEQGLFK